jgi:hypothetical protein
MSPFGDKGSGHNYIHTSCFIAGAFLLILISDVFNACPGIGGMMLKYIMLLASKQVVKHVGMLGTLGSPVHIACLGTLSA